MNSKNYLLWGLALALLFSLDSCKPKESAYKAAYEAAKAREIEENKIDEVTPVSKPSPTPTTSTSPTTSNVPTDAIQKEKVTVVDGAGILQFSVVVGSYINKTNAEAEKEKMAKQGFKSFLAQNQKGMYRVIVATFSDRASAVAERERVKSRYYPEYQDAWILDNQ